MMYLVRKRISKHRALVLRCYPKGSKKINDVLQPQASELSYLLFYVSSRRTKMEKVVSFLLEKTSREVSRMRIGHLHVTLDILKALIHNCSHDIQLVALQVLQTIQLSLRCDVNSVLQAAASVLDVFCAHAKTIWLCAERGVHAEFAHVVETFIFMATGDDETKRGRYSSPATDRHTRRLVGLRAIHSVTRQDSLSRDHDDYFDLVLPVLLNNLWTQSHCHRDPDGKSGGNDEQNSTGLAPQHDHQNEAECAACLAKQSLSELMAIFDEGETRSATEQVLEYISAQLGDDKPGATNAGERRAAQMLEVIGSPGASRHRAVVAEVILAEIERRDDATGRARVQDVLSRAVEGFQEPGTDRTNADDLLLKQHSIRTLKKRGSMSSSTVEAGWTGRNSESRSEVADANLEKYIASSLQHAESILKPSSTFVNHRLQRARNASSASTSNFTSTISKVSLSEPESSKVGRNEVNGSVLSVGELKAALQRDMYPLGTLTRDLNQSPLGRNGIQV